MLSLGILLIAKWAPALASDALASSGNDDVGSWEPPVVEDFTEVLLQPPLRGLQDATATDKRCKWLGDHWIDAAAPHHAIKVMRGYTWNACLAACQVIYPECDVVQWYCGIETGAEEHQVSQCYLVKLLSNFQPSSIRLDSNNYGRFVFWVDGRCADPNTCILGALDGTDAAAVAEVCSQPECESQCLVRVPHGIAGAGGECYDYASCMTKFHDAWECVEAALTVTPDALPTYIEVAGNSFKDAVTGFQLIEGITNHLCEATAPLADAFLGMSTAPSPPLSPFIRAADALTCFQGIGLPKMTLYVGFSFEVEAFQALGGTFVIGRAWSSSYVTGCFVTGCTKLDGEILDTPLQAGITLGLLFSDDLQCDLNGASFIGSVDTGVFVFPGPTDFVMTSTGKLAIEKTFAFPSAGIGASLSVCVTAVTDDFAWAPGAVIDPYRVCPADFHTC